jgi:hypothetical protein
MPDLFTLAPYIAGFWAACFVGLAVCFALEVRRDIRADQAEEERRAREDREVAALEAIPVMGEWEQAF